jgi:ribosome assembly protein 4
MPYYFYINGTEITKNIQDTINSINKTQNDKISFEESIQIKFFPQALFKVKPVSRCTSSLPGHRFNDL